MWKRNCVFAVVVGLSGVAFAQVVGGEKKDYSQSPVFVKMMAMDKNKDGKLTKDEVTDQRLMRLFEEADTNHDGVVTREELLALAAKLEAEVPAGSGRGGPGGGPGGFDGPPGGAGGFDGPLPDGGPDGQGRGRGGPGGRGGFGPPPQAGQVLPGRLQDELKLTDDQKKQIAELQKEVDAKLAKILTQEQLTQMKQMRGRGPGGDGGRGGNGGGPPQGPGGPGGDQ